MKKMTAAWIAAMFVASLLGCAAQMADRKTGWDEQAQETQKRQADERMWKKVMEP